jgi:hypothetical protein
MTAITWKPSEKQVTYVTKLVNEKVAESERGNWFHHLRSVDSNSRLDAAIKKLQAMPYLNARPAVVFPPNIPDADEAYYALGEGSHWEFYQISRPKEGQWAGRTFLKLEVSEDTVPIRSIDRINKVLAEIAKDPRMAAINYGIQTERCSQCHRKLTNDVSRAAGIGPVCAGKVGW